MAELILILLAIPVTIHSTLSVYDWFQVRKKKH